MRAEDSATLTGDLVALAPALGIAPAQDIRALVASVFAELGRCTRWLVVFDNATNQASLHAFLPQGAGHVLITSQHHVWNRTGKSLAAETLTRDEAIEFLLKRTETPPPWADERMLK